MRINRMRVRVIAVGERLVDIVRIANGRRASVPIAVVDMEPVDGATYDMTIPQWVADECGLR